MAEQDRGLPRRPPQPAQRPEEEENERPSLLQATGQAGINLASAVAQTTQNAVQQVFAQADKTPKQVPSTGPDYADETIESGRSGLRQIGEQMTPRNLLDPRNSPGGRFVGRVVDSMQRQGEENVAMRDQQRLQQEQQQTAEREAHLASLPPELRAFEEQQDRIRKNQRATQGRAFDDEPVQELGFGTGVEFGFEQMKAVPSAVEAMVRGIGGDEQGAIDAARRAEEIRMGAMHLVPDEASLANVDLKDPRDVFKFAQFAIASNMADGVTGLLAALGTRNLAGGVTKRLVGPSTQSALRATAQGTEQARRAALEGFPARAVKRAQDVGTHVGGGVVAGGMYAPDIAVRTILDEESDMGIQQRATAAAIGTTLTGMIGAIPTAHLLSVPFKRLGLDKAADRAVNQSFLKAVGSDVLQNVKLSMPSEILQEMTILATHKYVNDNIQLFDDEAIVQYLDAAAASGISSAATTGALSGASLGVKNAGQYAIQQLDRMGQRDAANRMRKLGLGDETTVHAATPANYEDRRMRLEGAVNLSLGQRLLDTSPEVQAAVADIGDDEAGRNGLLKNIGQLAAQLLMDDTQTDAEKRGAFERLFGDKATEVMDRLQIELGVYEDTLTEILHSEQPLQKALDDVARRAQAAQEGRDLDERRLDLADEFQAMDAEDAGRPDSDQQGLDFNDTSRAPEPAFQRTHTRQSVGARGDRTFRSPTLGGDVWLATDVQQRLKDESIFRDEVTDTLQPTIDRLNARAGEGAQFARARLGDVIAQESRSPQALIDEAETMATRLQESNRGHLIPDRGDDGAANDHQLIEEAIARGEIDQNQAAEAHAEVDAQVDAGRQEWAKALLNQFEVIQEEGVPRAIRGVQGVSDADLNQATQARRTRDRTDPVEVTDPEGNKKRIDIPFLVRRMFSENDVVRMERALDPESKLEEGQGDETETVMRPDELRNTIATAVGAVMDSLQNEHGWSVPNIGDDTVVWRRADGTPLTLKAVEAQGDGAVARAEMGRIESEITRVFGEYRQLQADVKAAGMQMRDIEGLKKSPNDERKPFYRRLRKFYADRKAVSEKHLGDGARLKTDIDLDKTLKANSSEYRLLTQRAEKAAEAARKQTAENTVAKQRERAQKEAVPVRSSEDPEIKQLTKVMRERGAELDKALTALEKEGFKIKDLKEEFKEATETAGNVSAIRVLTWVHNRMQRALIESVVVAEVRGSKHDNSGVTFTVNTPVLGKTGKTWRVTGYNQRKFSVKSALDRIEALAKKADEKGYALDFAREMVLLQDAIVAAVEKRDSKFFDAPDIRKTQKGIERKLARIKEASDAQELFTEAFKDLEKARTKSEITDTSLSQFTPQEKAELAAVNEVRDVRDGKAKPMVSTSADRKAPKVRQSDAREIEAATIKRRKAEDQARDMDSAEQVRAQELLAEAQIRNARQSLEALGYKSSRTTAVNWAQWLTNPRLFAPGTENMNRRQADGQYSKLDSVEGVYRQIFAALKNTGKVPLKKHRHRPGLNVLYDVAQAAWEDGGHSIAYVMATLDRVVGLGATIAQDGADQRGKETEMLTGILKGLKLSDVVTVEVLGADEAAADADLRPAMMANSMLNGIVKVAVKDGKITASIFVPEGQSAQRRVANLSHELGHAVFRAMGERVDKATATQMLTAFNEWRVSRGDKPVDADAILRSKKPIVEIIEGLYDRAHGDDPKVKRAMADHLDSFEEWFADNFARWATTDRRPTNVVEKFFSDLGKALKAIAKWAMDQTMLRSMDVGDPKGDLAVRSYLNRLWDSDSSYEVVRNTNLWAVLAKPIKQIEGLNRKVKSGKLRQHIDSFDDVVGRDLTAAEQARIMFASFVDLADGFSDADMALIQDMLLSTLSTEELSAMAKAFTAAPVRRQVLRALHEAGRDNAVLEADRNVLSMMAYGYQMWKLGGLDMSRFQSDSFNKMNRFLAKKVFGDLAQNDQAEAIMQAIKDGTAQTRENVYTESKGKSALEQGRYFLTREHLRTLERVLDSKRSKFHTFKKKAEQVRYLRRLSELEGLSDQEIRLLVDDIRLHDLNQAKVASYRERIARRGYVSPKDSLLQTPSLRGPALHRFARLSENLLTSMGTSRMGRMVLGTAAINRWTKNAALADINNAIVPDVTGSRQGLGFLNAKWTRIRDGERRVQDIFRHLDTADIDRVKDAFIARQKIDASKHPEAAKAQQDVAKVMREAYEYTKASGVEVGERDKDGLYWPLIFDGDKQRTDDDYNALIDHVAQKKFLPFWRKLIKKPENMSEADFNKALPDMVRDYMSRVMDDDGLAIDDGTAERAEENEAGVIVPRARNINIRALDFLVNGKHVTDADRQALVPYLSQDFGRDISNYLGGMYKRAEFARHFGPTGHKFKAMLDRARDLGATDRDIEHAQNTLRAAMGTIGLEMPGYARTSINAFRKIFRKGPLEADDSSKARQSRVYRQTMGWAVVFQNMAVLGLSALTNFADAANISIRTEDPGEVTRQFLEGLRAMKADFDNPTELGILVNELRAVEDFTIYNQLVQFTGGVQYTGLQRRVNEGFFKWNGMTLLTKFLRVVATGTSRAYIIKHTLRAAEGNDESRRALEDLGLRDGDIKLKNNEMRLLSSGVRQRLMQRYGIDEAHITDDILAPEALADLQDTVERGGEAGKKAQAQLRRQKVLRELSRDNRVRSGLLRLIDESVTRPNSNQRPTWGSDPNYAVFFHLKGFMYAYQERMIRRVATQLTEGNVTPVMLLLTIAPAMMFGMDMLREYLQHWRSGSRGSPLRRNMNLADYYLDSVHRSGALGVATLVPDMFKAAELGGAHSTPGKAASAMFSLAGPTVDNIRKIGQAAVGNRNATRTAIEQLPFNTVYKYWLRPLPESLEHLRMSREVGKESEREFRDQEGDRSESN